MDQTICHWTTLGLLHVYGKHVELMAQIRSYEHFKDSPLAPRYVPDPLPPRLEALNTTSSNKFQHARAAPYRNYVGANTQAFRPLVHAACLLE